MSGPTVLILGGIASGFSRTLVNFLVKDPSVDPKPSHIRIADKSLILPGAGVFTIYVDDETKEVLKKGAGDGTIEYRQANLLVESSRQQAFTLPDKFGGPDKAYDYVLDFTGEGTFDSAEEVYIERIAKLGASLGREATQRGGVKGYVKIIPGFYKTASGKVVSETDDTAQPLGLRQTWFHEAARALAAIEPLNLAVLRSGLVYGPGITTSLTPYIAIGQVYKTTGKKMELLWGKDLHLSTVHSLDLASATWSVAQWLASLSPPTRETALAAASSVLAPCRPLSVKTKIPTSKSEHETADIETLAPRTSPVKAPVFNVVDESETAQGELGEAIANVFGIKHGFQSDLISKLAAMDLQDTAEEIHEKHWDPWVELLGKSKPPITNSPVSPDLPIELVSGEAVWLEGGRLSKVTGWKPKHPKLTPELIKEVVEKFQKEGVWPNA